MKILCLIDGLGFGGAQRQMIGLVHLLKKKGFQTDLACYHERDFYKELLDKLQIKPILLKTGNGKFSKVKNIHLFIKKEGYDTVITYMDGPNVIGCLIKLFYHSKFNLIVSDRITIQYVSKSTRLRYWLYRLSNYIVPNSYSQAAFILENFPYLKDKVHTITNFTDTSFFTPKADAIQTKGLLDILVAGRIDEQKNIPNFLLAMSILKKRRVSFHVKWFGNVQRGTENYYQEIIKQRDSLGLTDDVEFKGGTSDIRNEYRNCDIFCLPSLYEGFPNVLCEAMSCGKPVIASNVCDNPLIVEEGGNGFLFDPKNPNVIADCVEMVANMSLDKLKLFANRSRELAIEKLSEEAFVDKYIELIKN